MVAGGRFCEIRQATDKPHQAIHSKLLSLLHTCHSYNLREWRFSTKIISEGGILASARVSTLEKWVEFRRAVAFSGSVRVVGLCMDSALPFIDSGVRRRYVEVVNRHNRMRPGLLLDAPDN